MDTNPIKVIWLSIGRHVSDSDLVVSDIHVARNGEASGPTISLNDLNRGDDDGNRDEATGFARALARGFGETEPLEGRVEEAGQVFAAPTTPRKAGTSDQVQRWANRPHIINPLTGAGPPPTPGRA